MKKFAADWADSRKLHDRIKAKIEEQKIRVRVSTPKSSAPKVTTPRRVSSRVV